MASENDQEQPSSAERSSDRSMKEAIINRKGMIIAAVIAGVFAVAGATVQGHFQKESARIQSKASQGATPDKSPPAPSPAGTSSTATQGTEPRRATTSPQPSPVPAAPGGTSPSPKAAEREAYIERLGPGDKLGPGDAVQSKDGSCKLRMEHNGELTLREHGKSRWDSGFGGKYPGAFALMQTDGNFVHYHGNTALRGSNTEGNPGAYMIVSNAHGCSATMYTKDGRKLGGI